MTAGVKLFGDWDKIVPFVTSVLPRWHKAVDQALLKEGHLLRKQIITGITSGAPGGQPLAPLSPLTLAVRKFKGFGGGKPLIYSGTMRNSVVVQKTGTGGVFIGLLRQAQAKDGKSMANLGEIHEFGRTWTAKRTRKQLRFLFAALRRMGGPVGRDKQGRYTRGKWVPKPGGGGTVTIPARPFVGPVFEKERAQIGKRFWENVGKAMGGDFRMSGG